MSKLQFMESIWNFDLELQSKPPIVLLISGRLAITRIVEYVKVIGWLGERDFEDCDLKCKIYMVNESLWPARYPRMPENAL